MKLRPGPIYYSICRRRLGHAAVRGTLRLLRRAGLLRAFRMPLDALYLDHEMTAGLMRLWSRIHWSSGDGMMPPEQLLAIYRLAATWPVSGDVVELGSWVGLTTSYLARACEVFGDGVVHAVDTFQGTKEGGTTYPSVRHFQGSTLEAFRDQLARAGVAHQVREHIGLTHDVSRRYDGRPIRILLIDADHSFEGVRDDFEDWSPLLATGGLVIFHDYDMPEVRRFVDEDVRSNQHFAFSPGPVAPNVVAVTRLSPAVPARRAVRSPFVVGQAEPASAGAVRG